MKNINKFKKYWVFCFSDYYPMGGMSDFVSSFDTENEAKNFIILQGAHDNVQILNTETGVQKHYAGGKEYIENVLDKQEDSLKC